MSLGRGSPLLSAGATRQGWSASVKGVVTCRRGRHSQRRESCAPGPGTRQSEMPWSWDRVFPFPSIRHRVCLLPQTPGHGRSSPVPFFPSLFPSRLTQCLVPLQKDFTVREELQQQDVERWLGFITFLCEVFGTMRSSTGEPFRVLVCPIYTCLREVRHSPCPTRLRSRPILEPAPIRLHLAPLEWLFGSYQVRSLIKELIVW